MFHPLLPDLKELKLIELESKISDLSKKYFISARSGNGSVCQQIALVLEQYKAELQLRNFEASQQQLKNTNQDLDSLINVNR
jgi:hypothetical protein